jgi:hypothetical protein
MSTVVTGAVAAGGVSAHGLYLEVTTCFWVFGSALHIKKPPFLGPKRCNRFYSTRVALYVCLNNMSYCVRSRGEFIGTNLDAPLFRLDNTFTYQKSPACSVYSSRSFADFFTKKMLRWFFNPLHSTWFPPPPPPPVHCTIFTCAFLTLIPTFFPFSKILENLQKKTWP